MADGVAPTTATPANTPVPTGTKPATATAPPVKGATAATPVPESFLEMMVDGQSRKFSKEEVHRFVGKGAFADKTVQQAKEALKASQALKEERENERRRLKEETEAYLAEQGIDLDALARRRLDKKVAEHQMTPEQRANAELQEKVKALEDKVSTVDKEKAAAAEKAQQKALQQRLENDLAGAAEAAGIPKDGNGFYAVYMALKEFVDSGLPYDSARVVELAKENLDGARNGLKQAVLKDMDGAGLEEMLGAQNVEKLIRYRMDKVRGVATSKTAAPKPAATSATVAEQGEYISRDELRARRLKLGGA